MRPRASGPAPFNAELLSAGRRMPLALHADEFEDDRCRVLGREREYRFRRGGGAGRRGGRRPGHGPHAARRPSPDVLPGRGSEAIPILPVRRRTLAHRPTRSYPPAHQPCPLPCDAGLQGDPVRGVEGDRVDGLAVQVSFEVQVRPGGAPFVAAVRDELAGLDCLPDGDRPAADVPVDGADAARVGDLDPLAVAAGGSGDGDGAVAGGVDRGADRRAEVNAAVQPSPARARCTAPTPAL
jgi:hypothetical protein